MDGQTDAQKYLTIVRQGRWIFGGFPSSPLTVRLEEGVRKRKDLSSFDFLLYILERRRLVLFFHIGHNIRQPVFLGDF
jgi:hypothetical protein